MIYLDHNATTPVLPEVVDAMLPYLREHFGNPSSSHSLGRTALKAVERARESVARLLNVKHGDVLFTSGGTEANNLALRGVRGGERAVTSVIEHPAVLNVLEQSGRALTKLGVDQHGVVDVAAAKEALSQRVGLVSLMHSNNETGVLQPVAEVAALAHAAGAVMHTDAAQSVGKVALDVEALQVDLLSVAGHKLYAPKGVGALYVRSGIGLKPLLLGGGHEHGLRPGTENVASIVGLGVACDVARRDLLETSTRLTGLRDSLHALLQKQVAGLGLNGHPTRRLPNTLNVRFPKVSGTALLEATEGVAASTGSACHDGSERASVVILAMGVSLSEAVGSVRLTLGRSTTQEDVDAAARRLVGAWHALNR